ncbi:MAG: Stk1 family PASTA domain-containing Ser/Thr kinase [Lachnospiraceae bacterium]
MIKLGMIIADRYEVIEKIGTGGMSDVYRAIDHKLNRYVAVKVLKQEFSENADFVSKFRMEAQAAAGLMHPNIVNVYDVGEEAGFQYIVMELVEGITLKKYIEKKSRLTVKEAVSIAIQVSMGIEAAHNNHIIHRDIKPQNIIISKEGKVKVTDFGIAKAATSNTITSNVMGSVHYTSPEQVRGGFSDEKSDIYSLGITLFEMLTGRVPFNGETTVAVAIKHIQEQMPSPREFVPEIPISVEQIVMKCTQKSADRRYQSAPELVEDLKKSLISPDENFVKIDSEEPGGATKNITSKEMEVIKRQSRQTIDEKILRTGNMPKPVNELRTDGKYEGMYGANEEYPEDGYGEKEFPEDLAGQEYGYDPAYGDVYVTEDGEYIEEPLYDEDGNLIHPEELYYEDGEYIQEPMAPKKKSGSKGDGKSGSSKNGSGKSSSKNSDSKNSSGKIGQSKNGSGKSGQGKSNSGKTSAGKSAKSGKNVVAVSSTKGGKNATSQTRKPARRRSEEEYDPKMELLTTIMIVVAAVVIACIFLYVIAKAVLPGFTLFSSGTENNPVVTEVQEVNMPPVVGKNVNEAVASLQNIGLLADVQYEESATVAENVVISASLNEGVTIAKGSTVTLMVSSGTEGVQIVNVVGKSQAEAAAALRDEGFEVRVTRAASEDVARDYVISQNPSQGTAPRGTEIEIVVSTGIETVDVEVPSVLEMSEDDAILTFLEAGLTAEAGEEQYSDTVEAGLVCYQSPQAGMTIKSDTIVEYRVSLGPEPAYYSCNTQVSAPADYIGGDAGIVLFGSDGSQLFSTVTSSFPVTISVDNIWSISSGTIYITYMVNQQEEVVDEAGNVTIQNVPVQKNSDPISVTFVKMAQ